MNLQYEIHPFSQYDNWTFRAKGDNVSAITDKLIRLAAKLTERFASDILYDIDALRRALQHWHDLDVVLFFNESGVRCKDVGGSGTLLYSDRLGECIQAWRLTYDPETTTTILQRVTLSAKLSDYTTDYVGYGI